MVLPAQDRHWFRDSTLLVMALTALVFLVGYFRQTAYFRSLGIPGSELDFPIQYYMVHSTAVLLWASVLFLLWMFADLLWQRRSEVTAELFRSFGPAAMALSASVVYAAVTMTMLGDASTDLLPGPSTFTVIDLMIWVSAGGLCLWIGVGQLSKRHSAWYVFFGRSRSANVILTALAVMFLLFGAQTYGVDAGNDLRWGCHSFKAVEFETTPALLHANHTYALLLHANDIYYLRDMDWSGHDAQYLVIQDDVEAFVYQHDALNRC